MSRTGEQLPSLSYLASLVHMFRKRCRGTVLRSTCKGDMSNKKVLLPLLASTGESLTSFVDRLQ